MIMIIIIIVVVAVIIIGAVVRAAAVAARGGLFGLIFVGEDECVVCKRRQLSLELVVEVVSALHVRRLRLLEEVVDVDELFQEGHRRIVVGAAGVHGVAIIVIAVAVTVGEAEIGGVVFVGVAFGVIGTAVQALEVRHWNRVGSTDTELGSKRFGSRKWRSGGTLCVLVTYY